MLALRGAARAASARRLPATFSRSIASSALRSGELRSYHIAHLSAAEPSKAPFTEPTGINPADATANLSDPLHQYGQYLITCLPKYIQQFSVYKDELTIYIPPSAVVPVLTFLRDHSQCQYKAVMDITAVDYPTRAMRFEVSLVILRYRCSSHA